MVHIRCHAVQGRAQLTNERLDHLDISPTYPFVKLLTSRNFFYEPGVAILLLMGFFAFSKRSRSDPKGGAAIAGRVWRRVWRNESKILGKRQLANES